MRDEGDVDRMRETAPALSVYVTEMAWSELDMLGLAIRP